MSLPRPLLSAERTDSQLETQQTTVSLVKMSKREFIYNVTASVSSELKDKHIHIYSTMKLSQKTAEYQTSVYTNSYKHFTTEFSERPLTP